MSTISVVVDFAGAALASGTSIKNATVQVVDSANNTQTATLTGAETPPWTTSFTVASGAGNVTGSTTDSSGASATIPSQAYTTSTTAAGPTNAASGFGVSVTTP